MMSVMLHAFVRCGAVFSALKKVTYVMCPRERRRRRKEWKRCRERCSVELRDALLTIVYSQNIKCHGRLQKLNLQLGCRFRYRLHRLCNLHYIEIFHFQYCKLLIGMLMKFEI